MSPRALLLDLEGTATSIAFVKDTLFPYANENVEKFLTASWESEDVQAAVEGMRQQANKDVENKVDGAIPIPDKDCPKEEQITGVSKNLRWLNDIGNKGTFMKTLSGYIWKYGYDNGEIKGHVYEDVKPAIEKWKKDGKKVFIYSSGSVLAQKLLMKYSSSGDLESVIDNYFDTEVGNKREVASYNNILGKIEFPGTDVLFLTDIVEEANAASEAGISSILLSREGNAPLTDEAKEKYTVVTSFADVDTAVSLKRKATVEEELPPAKISKTADENIVENGKVITEDAPTEIVEDSEKMDVDIPEVVENTKIEMESTPEDEIKTVAESEKILDKTEDIPVNEEKKNEKKSDDDDKTEEPIIVGQIPSEMETDECNIPEKTAAVETQTIVDEPIIEKTEPVTETVAIEKKEELVEDSKPISKEEDTAIIENNKEEAEKIEIAPKEVVMEDNTESKNDDVAVPTVDEERLKTEETEKTDIDNADSLPVTDVPIISNDDDDDAELLEETGIALVKECEEILSKVQQVTSAIVTKKIITTDENGTSDILLDIETNGDKIDDIVLDEILPEIKTDEITNDAVVEPVAVVPETPTEDVEDKTVSEVNGKVEISNGNGTHDLNGKNGDSTEELNGKTAEATTETETEHTNGTTAPAVVTVAETVEEQTEIKVKKILTEEPIIAEQTDKVIEA